MFLVVDFFESVFYTYALLSRWAEEINECLSFCVYKRARNGEPYLNSQNNTTEYTNFWGGGVSCAGCA